jgi:hypothetical protein
MYLTCNSWHQSTDITTRHTYKYVPGGKIRTETQGRLTSTCSLCFMLVCFAPFCFNAPRRFTRLISSLSFSASPSLTWCAHVPCRHSKNHTAEELLRSSEIIENYISHRGLAVESKPRGLFALI